MRLSLAAAPPPAEPLWAAGARASAVFGVTAGPLFGGGVFVERAFARRWGGSLRLTLEVAGTGALDVGPGRASFLRGAARVEGCLFTWRPARWLTLVPCLAVEGGALHGEGILGGSLTTVQQATVPWLGAGLLPRIGADLGPVILDVQGGPVFPLVWRTFVFHGPSYVIHELPPVTGMIGLGGGVRFP